MDQFECGECGSESNSDSCQSCGKLKSKNLTITHLLLGIAFLIIAKLAISIEPETITPIVIFIKATGGFLALAGLCLGFNAASNLIKSIYLNKKADKTNQKDK